jgi:hypothetical protein
MFCVLQRRHLMLVLVGLVFSKVLVELCVVNTNDIAMLQRSQENALIFAKKNIQNKYDKLYKKNSNNA